MLGDYNMIMGKQITMQHRSAFLKVFGDSPVLRVVDFLIVNDGFDYSMTDIAQYSGVGYTTLKASGKKRSLESDKDSFVLEVIALLSATRILLLI
jgi:hypothetical protein